MPQHLIRAFIHPHFIKEQFLSIRVVLSRPHELKKKSIREALTNFITVIQTSAKTPERRELVNSARLTVGYIYFELSSYKKALDFLRVISPEFYDYPEVLLAIGWSALKLQDYQATLSALSGLVTNYPSYFNLEEAHFVIGQCYLKLGYYDFAVKEYNELTKEKPKPTDYSAKLEQSSQELVIQEKLLEELNSELLVLESRLLLERSLTTSNGSIDFISVDQKQMKEKSQALYETLAKERRNFETLKNSLLSLKKQIDKDQINRNWRAYADYGKARALFLKSVPQ